MAGKVRTLCAAAGLCLALSGCAGSIQHWIVSVRVHQGAQALAVGNVHDAELSYRLALRVDPQDPRARAGYVRAAAAFAQSEYARGNFDDALATINDGLRYDPQSVRLAALKRTLEEARLQRDIVVSNYPSFRETGAQLQRAYAQLDTTNKLLLRSLKRFQYTFDVDDLSNAIKRSYEMQLDLVKNGNHLILYRQLVTSGARPAAGEASETTGASLLPLP
ncbi:MAG TPA: tetratricopeptide repeat protein [Candidatus Tumulicola sp.]|jgi:tetratricopeptide (TPR) repeat protein